MLNLVYYLSLTLGLSFLYSNAEPIKGNHVVTADEGEFPFVASIIHKSGDLNAERNHFCTGVLISKSHVLTAEHCLDNKVLDEIEIVLGSVDLRNGTRYNANYGINYTEWAENKGIPKIPVINDIAIIKLSEEVDERVAIPAKLSSRKRLNLFRPERVTVVGWGQTNVKPDKPSRYLQKASLTIPMTKQCEKSISLMMNEVIAFDDNVFCTKSEPFTLLGCGDSGGPLFNKKYNVIGINMGTCPKYSRLRPDQQNKRVNLHADVHYYETFINDVLMNY